MMLSRSALGRNAPRTVRKQCCPRRGFTASASPAYKYEATEAAGVKIATRELPGPTTTLKVVARAGSRFQPFPGYSSALENFAFKSTTKRSGLRINREVELLGGQLSAQHGRENLVLSARFFGDDLPYFAELLGEVISSTKYTRHELEELVLQRIKYAQTALAKNPSAQALETAYSLAFHRGLGEALTPSSSTPIKKYITEEGIASFAQGAFAKPSISIVASGANSTNVPKWAGEFFSDVSAAPTAGPFAPLKAEPAQYFGGEQRTASEAGNAVVIAFPGSSSPSSGSYKAEFDVLATLLGGESSIKYTPGFSLLAKAAQDFPHAHVSTKNATHSDAGLLSITVSGKADEVSKASKNVVEALQKVAAGEVSSEDIKKATLLAKFQALEAGEALEAGLDLTGASLINTGKPYDAASAGSTIGKVTEEQVKSAAKALLSGKASVATVGDLHHLPYASDLGLTV